MKNTPNKSLLNYNIEKVGSVSKMKRFLIEHLPLPRSSDDEYQNSQYRKYLVKKMLKNKSKKVFFLAFNNKKDIAALFVIEHLDWDSRVLNIKAARMDYCILKSHPFNLKYQLSQSLINEVFDYCKNNSIRYITSRLDPNDLFMIHSLEASGFKLLDVLIKFEKKINSNKQLYLSGCNNLNIRLYQNKDLSYLQGISSASFTYDRFHQDPLIPKASCDYLHKLWIKNLCIDNQNIVFVALGKNRPIGFIALTQDKALKGILGIDIFSIILIAVDSDFRRKGIGKALVSSAIKYIQNKRCICEVGTQINNIAACTLYESLEFRMFHSYLTYRKYFD